MFGKVKRLEAEIQRLERYYEVQRSHTDRVERSLNLLMEHLKVYEHVEPAQPEKRELRKGKRPAPKYEPMSQYNQMRGQQNAGIQGAIMGGAPGGWFRVS